MALTSSFLRSKTLDVVGSEAGVDMVIVWRSRRQSDLEGRAAPKVAAVIIKTESNEAYHQLEDSWGWKVWQWVNELPRGAPTIPRWSCYKSNPEKLSL